MNESTPLKRAADWLQTLRDTPNDPASVAAWEQWVGDRPENLEAFAKIEALWSALESPEANTRLRAHLDAARRNRSETALPSPAAAAPIRSQPRAHRFLRVPALGIAALVLASVATLWIVHELRGEVMATSVAELDARLLEDGSHVELGAQSRIRTLYTPSRRDITVEVGEAYFQVAKEPRRPFVVKSGHVVVTAIGTAFSVHRTNERITVTVTEGRVAVAESGAATPAYLTRGEQGIFDESTRTLSVATVDLGNALGWRNGILRFVNQPLSAVIEDVNRYSGKTIRVADPALGARLYTGTIYPERIDDWLYALEEVFPLQVERAAHVIRLTRAE